ncbi:Cell wall-associated hydrolase, NlpC family [Nocardioides terrae]|uniref:Cell wall-associated hydrolase, NlpC family n=1 Tax=Nocardioides terrae TaxID=574651 RepID=A0A1I1MKK8_9ACTN|nr:C40 family peptidase [Nocardioides terrae]SFC83738.1 Cell wall-associated hydrolase, NlpC family [Nocardioides terrae]
MSNLSSLRPALRALLTVLTVSVATLSLPAAAAPATVPVSSTVAPAAAETAPLTPEAAARAARLERRRAARERRHAVRERRHQRRLHRAAVVGRKELRAFAVAVDQKGDPYVWGATGPDAFDCSGLTSYAYKRAGLSLPRTAAAQSGAVRHIPRSQLRRGDLVFFSDGGHVYHVGLYAGRHGGTDYVLHAPRPGQGVQTVPIWTGSWFGGTLR